MSYNRIKANPGSMVSKVSQRYWCVGEGAIRCQGRSQQGSSTIFRSSL